MIVEDPESYGIELPETLPPLKAWSTVTVERSVKLADLEKEAGMSAGTLDTLNPELRHDATPTRAYQLRVPAGLEGAVLATLDNLPEWSPPKPAFLTHRVRRGETLSHIARRYGTSVSAIMRFNNLRSANRIWPGQRLQIPVQGGHTTSRASFNPTEGTHTVRRGDSLYSIARLYSTTVDRIRRDNDLTSNTIYPGQKLKVAAGSRTDLRRYTVVRGDTPSGIASKSGVSLSALLRANGLSSRSTIYPGQVLVIP
jgi:membrane-bound lytic murein transglycosylase D